MKSDDITPSEMTSVGSGDHAADHTDPQWAWVEDWQRSGEPPATAPGLVVAGFAAALVAVAILGLSWGLAGLPWLAVAANVLIALGLAPALWLARTLPVVRWIAGGVVVGLVVGWIGALSV